MSYYFREVNKCVDALTEKAPALDQDIVFFDGPFVNLCMLLFYDNRRLY